MWYNCVITFGRSSFVEDDCRVAAWTETPPPARVAIPVLGLPGHVSKDGTITPIWCKAWAVFKYFWNLLSVVPWPWEPEESLFWTATVVERWASDTNPLLWPDCWLSVTAAIWLSVELTNGASPLASLAPEVVHPSLSFPLPSFVESRGSYTGQASFNFRYARPLSSLKPVTALGAGLLVRFFWEACWFHWVVCSNPCTLSWATPFIRANPALGV